MSAGVLRVLVADDEPLARRRLLRLLGALEDVAVAGECEEGASVIARVREGGVDVVLLDVQMPGLSGLDVTALLPGPRPLVILCTAHAEHAVAAFEGGVVDYLLKPVEAARLCKALLRARERLSATGASPGRAGSLERLAVPTRAGIALLDPGAISHAVLEGELVTIVTDQGTLLSDASLGELQARLPEGRFFRVHRRALLNLEKVVRLEPQLTGGFLARTQAGHAVEVSRQAARELRRKLGLR